MKAVSFDFGQTLAELDPEMLRARAAERGFAFDPAGVAPGMAEAVRSYGARKSEGHAVAWRAMVESLLRAGGVSAEAAPELSAWLWQQQPNANLWRKPIPGMIELVRELGRAETPLCIISNSEGHLLTLLEQLGWSRDFEVVADSGKLGIDKPKPGIFEHACRQLGVATSQLVHVGDSWEADVEGALGVSAQAVWFDPRHAQRTLPSGVHGAGNAGELREVLARLGLVS